jgi:putative ABC transport system permease protein
MNDFRYAARTLRRTPGFTAVAVLTLGLGIGATTAIFSAVNGVLLRPLPYPEDDRLTVLWLNNQQESIERDVTSYPTYLDWQGAAAYASMAGYTSTVGTLTGDGDAEQYSGAWVTGDFFRVLGVAPAVGRALDGEHARAGSHQVVVLSHGLWTRRFGGDPGILGRAVVVNDVAREVVGVMPRGFAYPEGAEFWLPIAPDHESWQQPANARGMLWLSVIGRLGPGATVAQASVELNGIMARLAEEELVPAGNGVLVEPLRDTIVGSVRPGLLILLGAVAFVLLIACVNVANLLLARGAKRRRELAVRGALGASGGRLALQTLAESLLLGGLGAALGLALASFGTAALVALSPQDLPRLDGVRVDGAVIGFGVLIALATGLIFGLAPAWQARNAALSASLRDAERGATGSGVARLRPTLVVVEVALALVLLIGAGLLARSFAALQVVDAGFHTERVLSFRVTTGAARYPEAAQVRDFQDRLLARLEGIPGVESATAVTTLFLARLPNMGPVALEGQPSAGEGEAVTAVTNDIVRPDFFRTMGVRLVRGRGFEATDVEGGPAAVIVNESFVRRFLAGEDPIGRRFTRGNPEDPDAVWQTIVGVVADTRRSGLAETVRPEAYRPSTQVAPRGVEVLVRTAGPPLAVVPQVRAVLNELDPNLAMASLRTVESALAEAVATRRFVMALLAGFAVLAVALAAIGIFGVLAYLVGQRTRELGIRMALGADRRAVQTLVLRESLRHVLPGIALGTAGALLLTRVLRSQLYGVSPTDPLTFLAVIVVLVGVALLASWIPARRAAGVDPMDALRQE